MKEVKARILKLFEVYDLEGGPSDWECWSTWFSMDVLSTYHTILVNRMDDDALWSEYLNWCNSLDQTKNYTLPAARLESYHQQILEKRTPFKGVRKEGNIIHLVRK